MTARTTARPATTAAPPSSPAVPAAPAAGLITMIREIEAATTMGEVIAAGDRTRDALHRASAAMYGAADAVYTKIKKTGKWPAVLRGLDKEHAARKQRKLYYEAAAAIQDAATAIRAVVSQQEEVLAAAKAKSRDFDPTK
jgi:hypothetical protein